MQSEFYRLRRSIDLLLVAGMFLGSLSLFSYLTAAILLCKYSISPTVNYDPGSSISDYSSLDCFRRRVRLWLIYFSSLQSM